MTYSNFAICALFVFIMCSLYLLSFGAAAGLIHTACDPCDCGRKCVMVDDRIHIGDKFIPYNCPCLEEVPEDMRRIETTEYFSRQIRMGQVVEK